MSAAREDLRRRRRGSRGMACTGPMPSAALCSPAPGQRLFWRRCERRLQRLVAQLRRDQLVLAGAAGARERERVGVDADARGGAERVVGAGVAEVVEPAEQVGRVGAEERELGRVALERVLGGLERALALLAVGVELARGDVAQRLLQARQLDQVVGAAGALDDLREVVDGRARVAGERAQLGEERAQLLGDGLGVLDERVEVVERGAQVDERGVRAALEVGQAADRLRERLASGCRSRSSWWRARRPGRRGRRGGRRCP